MPLSWTQRDTHTLLPDKSIKRILWKCNRSFKLKLVKSRLDSRQNKGDGMFMGSSQTQVAHSRVEGGREGEHARARARARARVRVRVRERVREIRGMSV